MSRRDSFGGPPKSIDRQKVLKGQVEKLIGRIHSINNAALDHTLPGTAGELENHAGFDLVPVLLEERVGELQSILKSAKKLGYGEARERIGTIEAELQAYERQLGIRPDGHRLEPETTYRPGVHLDRFRIQHAAFTYRHERDTYLEELERFLSEGFSLFGNMAQQRLAGPQGALREAVEVYARALNDYGLHFDMEGIGDDFQELHEDRMRREELELLERHSTEERVARFLERVRREEAASEKRKPRYLTFLVTALAAFFLSDPNLYTKASDEPVIASTAPAEAPPEEEAFDPEAIELEYRGEEDAAGGPLSATEGPFEAHTFEPKIEFLEPLPVERLEEYPAFSLENIIDDKQKGSENL